MSIKYSILKKNEIVSRYINGETISSIGKSTRISRTTIYSWIKNKQQYYNMKSVNLRDVHHLKQTVKRQKQIIEVLQRSACTASAPLCDRYAVITDLSNKYCESSLLCEALCVEKGSYYNFKLRSKHCHTVNKWLYKRAL